MYNSNRVMGFRAALKGISLEDINEDLEFYKIQLTLHFFLCFWGGGDSYINAQPCILNRDI